MHGGRGIHRRNGTSAQIPAIKDPLSFVDLEE